MLYNQLEAEGQTLPTLTKVMTLLNALPKDWQQLVTHQVLNQPAVANITWAVTTAVIGNHWDGLQAHKKHLHAQTRVNKLLAVQRKGPNQTLQQQMAPYPGSSSKAPQKKGKGKACARGTREKGKAWKPHINFFEHQAACDAAMLTEESCPAPTLHMVSSIGPSSISTQTETKTPISSTGTNSMWPTFNAAMRLANRIGECSMGSVKTLEMSMFTAPISQVVQQSIAPSALDPMPDYNTKELSCGYTEEEHYTTCVNDLVAGGCTHWLTKIKRANTDVELTWDMMEADKDTVSLFGDFNDSIMDLVNAGNGYGDNEYVSSPLTKTLINCPSVRISNLDIAGAVVGRALLQKLTCKHTHNKCNCRTLNRDWMLDSGATVHLSPYMADFIDYTPALIKGNVHTAEGPTDLIVEESGMVLIQHVFHYQGKPHKELLWLQEVLYIPGVIAHFTSLVHLLKEGLHIYGDAAGMNLFTRENNSVPLICAEPWDSEMLFWLKAEQISLNGVESIYSIDYDLLHRHLGHPSKDMQKQTQWHTAGLPDVKLPCKMPICPGCVLGKMSQQPFPHSGKHAAQPLDKIHSNLKSFPIESYH